MKIGKGTDHVLTFKSKGVFNSKLKPLYTTFLSSIKRSEYRTQIKDPLAVEQSNYLTKIVNVYIVCDLDNWPKNPLRNFTLKNCLIGATNIVTIVIKTIMYILDTEEHLM